MTFFYVKIFNITKNPNTRHSEILQIEIMKWIQIAFKKKYKNFKKKFNTKTGSLNTWIRSSYGLQNRKRIATSIYYYFIIFQDIFSKHGMTWRHILFLSPDRLDAFHLWFCFQWLFDIPNQTTFVQFFRCRHDQWLRMLKIILNIFQSLYENVNPFPIFHQNYSRRQIMSRQNLQ